MKTSGKDSKESNRFRGIRPETEEKYRRAIEMYASTELSGCEICRICEVTESGFRCYLTKYHRELVLARYAILCSKEEAGQIKLGQIRVGRHESGQAAVYALPRDNRMAREGARLAGYR